MKVSKDSKNIGRQLAEKTYKELGIKAGKYGKLRESTRITKASFSSRNSPVNSRNLPFRIPYLEKTQRQAMNTQGYKASAYWQTATLLRDLLFLYCKTLPAREFRRRTQIEDAARSTVSTIEEGWARPSTKEFLDYLGFSQASLAEIRGDAERLLTDGLIKTGVYGNSRETTGVRIPNPSRNFPYPPVTSRRNPVKYGKLWERLREFTGRDIRPEDLTYEIFIELINKTDYLLTRTVVGLQSKIITDEKRKLNETLDLHWRKNW